MTICFTWFVITLFVRFESYSRYYCRFCLARQRINWKRSFTFFDRAAWCRHAEACNNRINPSCIRSAQLPTLYSSLIIDLVFSRSGQFESFFYLPPMDRTHRIWNSILRQPSRYVHWLPGTAEKEKKSRLEPLLQVHQTFAFEHTHTQRREIKLSLKVYTV